jgi:hypothetical protein
MVMVIRNSFLGRARSTFKLKFAYNEHYIRNQWERRLIIFLPVINVLLHSKNVFNPEITEGRKKEHLFHNELKKVDYLQH